MEWNGVATKISEDDRGKWDRKVPASGISIGEGGKLVAINGGRAPDAWTLSDLATGQLCERLSIPVAYDRRLPGEMQATVANFDLRRLGDRQFLVRGKTAHVRAVLSVQYVAYDNRQIAETVEGLLTSDAIHIKSFVLEETHCFVKLVSEELVDPASGLKAGIMIGNSEVGMGSVSVEPFVFRKACTNVLVVSAERTFRRAHAYFTPSELTRRRAVATGDAFLEASQVFRPQGSAPSYAPPARAKA